MNRSTPLFLATLMVLCCGLLTTASAQSGTRRRDSLLVIVNRVPQDTGSFKALTLLQRYYFEQGQFDSTLIYAKLALPLAVHLNDINKIAKAHHALSQLYTNTQK